MEKLKTTRILGVIGIAGLILGVILPYIKYEFLEYKYSLTLWGYWEGKIILILAIANLLFIFKDMVEKYVPSLFKTDIGKKVQNINNPKYSLVPTILSAIFAIYLTLKLDIAFKYYNLGFYALWIGVICLVAYAIIHKKDSND